MNKVLMTVALAWALGCSQPANNSGKGCVPGTAQGCKCTDGAEGSQQCASDGKHFEDCVCTPASDTTDTSGDVTTDTSTGADTGTSDTGTGDDTGTADTGTGDQTTDDTGTDDTGTDDTGTDDTGAEDTGTADTGAEDTGTDDTTGNEGTGELAVQPDGVKFKKGEVAVGGTITDVVLIQNIGDGPLEVAASFDYAPPAGVAELAGPSLQVSQVQVGGESIEVIDGSWGATLDAGAEMEVTLQFLRYDDNEPRKGTLVVQGDDGAPVTVKVTTAEGLPVAKVSPKLVDFGQVKAGESPKKPIAVSNTGSDPLLVTAVLFQGHPDFTFSHGGSQFEPGEAITFDPPIEIEPDGSAVFVVGFNALTDQPAEAKIVFYTNDPVFPSGILVEAEANTSGPCIKLNPKKLQFGGKLVGAKTTLPVEIISCGTSTLLIDDVHFAEGTSGDFDFKIQPLPIALLPNTIYELPIEYLPGEEGPDEGVLVIESNAFDSAVEVDISGIGVVKECPTAKGVVQEGLAVIPQTNLHLFGDQSFANSGNITSWSWSVEQPVGSVSVFVPSDNFPNPTFKTNTAGQYVFELEVWDDKGVKSCVPWQQTVLVVPDEAIHVELLWHTPNDPDETDQGPEAGSDVDLHFTHDAYAASGPDIDMDGKPDGWFDQPFDCFWFNAHPNWGSFDPAIDDDPGLDLDDTDGAGPENLNLNIPEDTDYRIGVHYWSDHEYGPSFITLRVYVYSELVFEVTDVKLVNHDMWDAAVVSWPSGKVTLVQAPGGGFKITANYQNPFFFQP